MKKVLFVACALVLMGFNTSFACDDCDPVDTGLTCGPGGCVDGYIEMNHIDVNAYGQANAWGDEVQTASQGMLLTNMQYGDSVDGPGGTYTSLSGWNSEGTDVAGGSAFSAFDRLKADTWGPTGVLVDGGDCGDNCLPGNFDATHLAINAAAGAESWGIDTNAFSTGQVVGQEVYGDPADGNIFSFANMFSSEKFGDGFISTGGDINVGLDSFKFNAYGSGSFPSMP